MLYNVIKLNKTNKIATILSYLPLYPVPTHIYIVTQSQCYSPLSHGGHIGYDVCILGIKSRRCVFNFSGLQLIMLNKIIVVCSCAQITDQNYLPSLSSRQICEGKLDCKICRYVGKNFRLVIVVYNCALDFVKHKGLLGTF